MDLREKAEKIMEEGYVCDHCLGRQFAQLLTGMDNRERGQAVRTYMAMLLDSGEEMDVDDANFRGFEFRSYRPEEAEKKECFLCKDLFENIDEWARKAMAELQGYEFENFLVGTRLPRELVKREEEIWEKAGIGTCEELKAEFNREVGKRLEEKTGKEVEFELPEVVVLLNIKEGEVELDVNSLCVYGEYQKLERGIPQTEWPSDKYEISLEEIIAPAFLRAADAVEEKFHGAGREDIDACCMGWRPFILEILQPKKREVDLEKVEEEVNRQDEVQVRNLQLVSRDKVEDLKSWRPEKSYRALVRLGRDVSEEELEKLKNLETVLEQKTPSRVLHRRSSRKRKRKVNSIQWEKTGDKEIELEVRAEAGTYIKEMISGDGGRTVPSVSDILGTEAECVELDVTGIHGKDELKFISQD